MTVLRVCYKHGVRFDEAYYFAKHLPLAASVVGPFGLKRVEVVKIATTPDGVKPAYQVMFSAYFASAADVQKALESPRIGEVLGDIKSFHDGMPDMMIGEVVALPGQ
jgi:uncharacterized protein (TIGR02118 family)